MLWNVSSFTGLPRFVVVVLFSVFVFAATCAAAAATVTVAVVRIIDEAQCIMCVCYARLYAMICIWCLGSRLLAIRVQ